MSKTKRHKELEEWLNIQIKQGDCRMVDEMSFWLSTLDKEQLLYHAVRMFYQIQLIDRQVENIKTTIIK